MKRTHHAEYLLRGAFFPESSCAELPERSTEAALRAMPDSAYGFRLYDRVQQAATLEDGRTIEHTEEVDKSGMFYPGGERLDRAAVERTSDARAVRAAGEAVDMPARAERRCEMGASIYWQAVKGREIAANTPSSLLSILERLGLSDGAKRTDLLALRAAAAALVGQDDADGSNAGALAELADAVEQHGAIRIWAEY